MKMKPRIISSVKGSLLYCFLEIYIDAEYPVISLFVCFFWFHFFCESKGIRISTKSEETIQLQNSRL